MGVGRCGGDERIVVDRVEAMAYYAAVEGGVGTKVRRAGLLALLTMLVIHLE
jgi:hypothetical protein